MAGARSCKRSTGQGRIKQCFITNTFERTSCRQHPHRRGLASFAAWQVGERARWLAANLIAHKVSFSDLSQAQVARLVQVNSGNVSRALGRAGRRGAQQRTLDHLIRRYGTDTLMRALDRATAPSMQAAE